MKDYELVMVLSPEDDETAVSSTLERLTRFVDEHGGTVTDQESWGLRRLAYPIKKFREGNYILTHLRLEPRFTQELDNSLMVTEGIIRHLLTKIGDSHDIS